MKYYHIIYNSSERNIDGGMGFGIRTATETTPTELISAIRTLKIFTDDWESYEQKPTPSQVKENPGLLASIAKNYAVTSISDEHGTVYHIIARRAYVGFDYGFYKNGMPTRLGNYVIDYYVFEDVCDPSPFEILYENPLAESNHFIPVSVCPAEDNLEMKLISLGSQPTLPVETKPFNAVLPIRMVQDVVKLFLYYLKAKHNGKKLVVKASKEKSIRLTADLYRMMPLDWAKEIRTFINLRTQGVSDKFDLFFIHEDYPYQIYDTLYDYVAIDSAPMPDTDEARLFGAELEKMVSDSYTEHKDEIYSIINWMGTSEFAGVKTSTKETVQAFFLYRIHPEAFSYRDIKKNDGNLNEELLHVLFNHFKANGRNAERFILIVRGEMSAVNSANVIDLIRDYNRITSLGLSRELMTESVRMTVCQVLMSDISLVKKSLDLLSYDGIEKFFVKSIFEEKKSYVDSDVLDFHILRLYKYFFTDEELKKKNDVLYSHFFKRDMDAKLFRDLVDDIFENDIDSKIDFFVDVLRNKQKPFDAVWCFLKDYLQKTHTDRDFLKLFELNIGDVTYAPILYYSIKKHKDSYRTIDSVSRLTRIMSNNKGIKDLVEKNYGEDCLYDAFYNEMKLCCRNNPREVLSAIDSNILMFLNVKDNRFEVLACYLRLVVTGDLGLAKQLDNEMLRSLYSEIVRQNNHVLFQGLLGHFVELVERGGMDMKELSSDFHRFNHQIPVVEALNILVPVVNRRAIAAIMDVYRVPFTKALSLLADYGLDSSGIEWIMKNRYRKEYVAYRRKAKIKSIFGIKRIAVFVSILLVISAVCYYFLLMKGQPEAIQQQTTPGDQTETVLDTAAISNGEFQQFTGEASESKNIDTLDKNKL